ncbi:hypothetical protein V6L77_06575 [Pannonibacter sp. Pt2-lr]
MTGAIVSAMLVLFAISVPIAISIGLASMIGLLASPPCPRSSFHSRSTSLSTSFRWRPFPSSSLLAT